MIYTCMCTFNHLKIVYCFNACDEIIKINGSKVSLRDLAYGKWILPKGNPLKPN